MTEVHRKFFGKIPEQRVEAVEVGILVKDLRTKLQIPEVQVGILEFSVRCLV